MTQEKDGAQKSERAVANLLRLASSLIRDGELLSSGKNPQNTPLLQQRAVDCLVAAILVSENGWPLPLDKRDIQEIPNVNPVKLPLARAAKLNQALPASALQPDGNLPEEFDRDMLRQNSTLLRQLLRDFAERFGVDLSSTEPAVQVAPIRPQQATETREEVPCAKPASKRPPVGSTETAAAEVKSPAGGLRKERPKLAPAPAVSEPEVKVSLRSAITVSPSRQGVSSTTFWSLMDRWSVPDFSALKLLKYRDGLTKKGTRPRFKLSEEQARMLRSLQELDQALQSLGVDASAWLKKPIREEPFSGSSALEHLMKLGLKGTAPVNSYILKNGLKLSMQSTR